MALQLIFTLLVLFQICVVKTAKNATDTAENEEPMSTTGNINDFVDDAIVHWRALLRESGYDPLSTDPINQGPASCKSCKIRGLSTIKRTGDVHLNASEKYLIIDLNMGLDQVLATCHCEARWSIFTIEGTISASLLDYSIAARLEQHSNRRQPELTSFQITNEGDLDTYFQGNGFLGTVIQWFGQSFIKNYLRKAISDSSKIGKLLGEAIKSLDVSQLMRF